MTFCYLGPWIAIPAGDSNLMTVWQILLPATHRLFIFLTRGNMFKLFLLHESVLHFQYMSLAVQKGRKWRGKGDVAGWLQCLELALCAAVCRVWSAVCCVLWWHRCAGMSWGKHRLVLPLVSAGNKPSRNMDSVSLVLVLCSCGCLDFFSSLQTRKNKLLLPAAWDTNTPMSTQLVGEWSHKNRVPTSFGGWETATVSFPLFFCSFVLCT